MFLIQGIITIILLLVIPLFWGRNFCDVFKIKDASIVTCLCLGTFVQWCVFQLISVPMILLRCSFVSLVVVTSIIFGLMIIFGFFLLKSKEKVISFTLPDNWIDRISIIVMLLVFAFGVYCQISFQHIDDDDSRFVVNIVDTIRTNKLLLANPATGEDISERTSELLRDVASPWAIFQAYIAYLAGIQATIFAHTVQPVALFVLLFAVQWEISEALVGKKIFDRCVFCIILWLLIWFGNYTGWSAEGFVVRRIWQGKAIVAGIGIPYMTLLLARYYQEESKVWIMSLLIANMAMCLLSNMGVLFGFVLVGVFGLVYGILKKKIKVCFLLWLTAVPNLFYGILSLII